MKLIITDLEDFSLPVSGEHKIIRPDEKLTQCLGCFSCWVKTPGKCVIADGFEEMGALWSKCDEVIIVCRCVYGGLSPFAKNVMDRSLAYVHPDFTIKGGEMHHKRRYLNKVRCSAMFYGDTTEKEQETARHIIAAIMDNFYGEVGDVRFFKTAGEMEGIAL